MAVVGQGTWMLEQADRAAAVAALRAGLDAGATHVDTAEMYGDGSAEEIAGEAIAGRRDAVFLASKVLPENAGRDATIRACEASLRRLGTDRLDLYLLHWREEAPLEETFDAFERLRADGKILHWGVSNFDVADLEDALAVAGEGRIACNQVLYHLQERAIEHRIAPWCEAHRVALVAYSPFGSGSFPAASSPGGRVLGSIAKAHGATARQVALAFLTRSENVFAIPKSAREAHARQNAGAGDLVLADEELATIDAAFPRGPEPRVLPVI